MTKPPNWHITAALVWTFLAATISATLGLLNSTDATHYWLAAIYFAVMLGVMK